MELIIKIKKKKELSGLSDKFVESILRDVLRKSKVSRELDKKSEKLIVKEVRAELRRYTGQYKKNRKNMNSLDVHVSTKERNPYYTKFTTRLSTLNPKSILDLGCGINPLAIANSKLTYYASDINEADLKTVSNFFKEKNIKGQVFYQDLRTSRLFPKTDLTLILKVFDLIDKKGHKNAESILKSLKSKHIIVSFSTKKLSGKAMNSPKRIWFENLLKRLGLKFKTFNIPNEIFYLILNKKP